MPNTFEFEQLDLAVIDLHDGRNGIRPAAALDRHEDLPRWLMNRHIVDDDMFDSRAEQRDKLLIDADHQIAAFEVLKERSSGQCAGNAPYPVRWLGLVSSMSNVCS
ncbi:hypothetical protein [Paraburkholderia phosphatilytica]|uniref:hypothetical protein n=1 Tax=Paraburkholderia phosphatilytica TaxID=2282883 RepID=UPI000E4B1211|nr:hypothetical protein [Paraburkholderia phosphatilytica]